MSWTQKMNIFKMLMGVLMLLPSRTHDDSNYKMSESKAIFSDLHSVFFILLQIFIEFAFS